MGDPRPGDADAVALSALDAVSVYIRKSGAIYVFEAMVMKPQRVVSSAESARSCGGGPGPDMPNSTCALASLCISTKASSRSGPLSRRAALKADF